MMTQSIRPDTQRMLDEAHEWRLRLSGTGVTEHTRAQFESWLAAHPMHPDIYDQAVTFWAALGEVAPSDLKPAHVRPTLYERAFLIVKRGAQAISYWPARLALGGMLAGLAALLVFNQGLVKQTLPAVEDTTVPAVYAAAIGAQKTVTLPDGSRVTLAPGSTIETNFSRSLRTITMVKGSAYFAAEKDPGRPFVVAADQLKAVAVGTEFVVKKSAGRYRVGVAEGVVDVAFPFIVDGTATSLMAKRTLAVGEQVSADTQNGLTDIQAVAPSAIAAWRDDRLVYTGASIMEVVDDLNRYSQTPIRIDDAALDMGNYAVQGAFDAKDVTALLIVLTELYPLALDRADPGVIVLRKRPALAD